MTSTCSWSLGNGERLKFTVYSLDARWKSVAGLYIFSFQTKNGFWYPLYVGQTDDFSIRLPTLEKRSLLIRGGATHIHARVVSEASERNRLEALLIAHLQPRMNTPLR